MKKMMTTEIQFVNLKKDPVLENMIATRLARLEKKYSWMEAARIFLKDENFTNGKDKICEAILSVPGPNIFTKSTEESFEAAIAQTFEDLEKLLHRHKGKMYKS
ncbi:MAG: HPF/RaiA family ribosome-associated protein [Saprospiraceae bacterium]|nr:MAG: HPF/RaiA family ribosome-associated protein [Saprospiraceae bacterium]